MKNNFQHTGIYCQNIDESIDFYTNKLGFKLLFRSDAMEGDKPLKMAWIKGFDNVVIELLELEDKSTIEAARNCLNHTAIRTDDMDAFVKLLNDEGIEIEAGPFDPPLEFSQPLDDEDSEVFHTYGDKGTQLRIMFFRGPGGERFEVLQDNIEPLS